MKVLESRLLKLLY